MGSGLQYIILELKTNYQKYKIDHWLMVPLHNNITHV